MESIGETAQSLFLPLISFFPPILDAVPLCPCTSAVVGQSFPNGSPPLSAFASEGWLGIMLMYLILFPPSSPFPIYRRVRPQELLFFPLGASRRKNGSFPLPRFSPLPCKMGSFSSCIRDLQRRERIEFNFHFLKAVSLSLPPPHLLNFSKKKCSWQFSGSFLPAAKPSGPRAV